VARISVPGSVLLVTLSLLAAYAQAAPVEGLRERVDRITLDNGMTFLLAHRGTAPVFAASLRFRVGSVDDPGGASGLAHLFEHLAFKGTSVIGTRDPQAEEKLLDAMDRVARDLNRELDRGAHADAGRLAELRRRMGELRSEHQKLVVKDEFSDILTRNGAQGLNASTSQDFTTYVVELPSNRLELWCLMESARLRDPVLREFYAERDVVMEERRMRVDNDPDGKMYEQLLLTAFQAHPYRVSPGGWMSDLERQTRPAAERFRRTYYVPNNAVAALVGDIDAAAAAPLLRRYFGGIPAAPPPPEPVTREPRQIGERRVSVEFDAEPQVMLAWHKPSLPDPDDTVFDVIDALLTSGRTSRLFRRLVLDTQVASNVYSFEAPGERFPNLFVIAAEPRAPHTAAEVEAEIEHELARLRDETASDREIDKIRNQTEAAFLYALRSNGGLAAQLSYYEILTGSWTTLLDTRDALIRVTPGQVREVVRRIFTPANRTLAILTRATEAPSQPQAGESSRKGADDRGARPTEGS